MSNKSAFAREIHFILLNITNHKDKTLSFCCKKSCCVDEIKILTTFVLKFKYENIKFPPIFFVA